MAREHKYTSIDRVFSKIYRDVGIENIDESQVIEWAGEALEHIGAITLYEEAIAYLEVRNHQAELPIGLHSIIQVARNNKWENTDKICPANVILDCPICTDTSCKLTEEEVLNSESKCDIEDTPLVLDCDGKIVGNYELAYYRPYFDLQYWYKDWKNSKLYQTDFTPVRLANHTFFGTLVEQEDESVYSKTRGSIQDEYTIVENMIRTSFKEGGIVISYNRQKIDPETGYPMIPDEVSVIQAITYYITWKYMQRMWYMGREGYSDKMQYAEKQWIWYCRQAGTKSMMLKGIDEHQNFTESRFQFIPSHKRYFGFFGKLGRSSNLNFGRNNGRATISGI